MSIDQGGPKRYALGVDFGTSNTVAVARWPDGRARPILVDGSPLLPSAVYADAEGNLLVGRDAVHSARLEPARFEPNPKRRVDDGLVLLGEREFEVVELISAVLARVAEEWHRAVGPYRPEVTLTCPAAWGATRRTLLAEAAARAGLEGARLVAEPVAAATYFAEVLGRDVPIGSVVVVHDFGAGTFDTSVVARTSTGFEVLAVDGRDDLGGLDVDAAIVEHLRTDDWARLMAPATVEERRARRQLWDDVRIAKERLSRAQSADFVVPLLDVEAHLTREELETVARPVLEQTVQVTRNILRWADLPDGRLAGVFLVGGASRIPLVATLLHRALGDPPVVIEQPELVVAEGSILAGAALLSTEPAAPGPTEELRLPSKYLPVRDGEYLPVRDGEHLPVRDGEPEPGTVPVSAAVTAERPTSVARPADDRPTAVASRQTVIVPRPIDDRPTAIAARPVTTPVPAIPSEQDPASGHPDGDVGTEKLPDDVLAVARSAAARSAEGGGMPHSAAADDMTHPADGGGAARSPEISGMSRSPEAGETALPSEAGGAPRSVEVGGMSHSADSGGMARSAEAHPEARSAEARREARSADAHSSGARLEARSGEGGAAARSGEMGGGALPQRQPRGVMDHPEPPGPDTPPHLRPPVDPWPDAVDNWRPDPEATVATSPPEPDPRGPARPPNQKRATQPVVAHARPVSPAMGSARPMASRPAASHPVSSHQAAPHPAGPRQAASHQAASRQGASHPVSSRPVSPAARAVVVPSAPPAPDQARTRRPRRRGRLRRAFQVMLSIVVMITVPIVALVLAYGYGNAEPIDQDAINVFRDIMELIGLS